VKSCVALLDANVLYPAPLRDLLLQLAVSDVIRVKWSADIHREWIRALLRREPHRDRSALERTRDLMDQALPGSLVRNYEAAVSSLSLPDEDDRHVLAAAIVGGCDVIVTKNIRDFPDAVLGGHGLSARHPDDFMREQLDLRPELFLAAVRKVRARLKAPPYSVSQYLDILAKQGLVDTVAELSNFSDVL
jgi:predicted nucleic acid-binding protein